MMCGKLFTWEWTAEHWKVLKETVDIFVWTDFSCESSFKQLGGGYINSAGDLMVEHVCLLAFSAA